MSAFHDSLDRIVVYDSKTLRAVYVPSKNFSLLVITFAPWLAAPSTHAMGFSEAFLRKNSIGALHVTCATNTWYQYDDMIDLAARTSRLRRDFGSVATYGQSMGGYAALQFMDLFRPTRVLAYAPQYSLNPSLVPFERRWTAEAAKIHFRHGGMSNWFGADVRVFYDPRTDDRHHVELIRRDLGTIELVPAPYSGHAIPRALQQMGLLATTTLAALRGTFAHESFRAAYRRQRRHSAVYLDNLSAAGRSLSRKIAICRQALRIDPDDGARQHTLAELLLRTGDLPGAATAAREALACFPDNQAFQRTLCVILRRAGQPRAALDVLAPAVRDGLADDATCRFYADVAASLGLLEEAEKALRGAILMAPAVHRSHFMLSHVLSRHRRCPEALRWAETALEMAPGEAAYQRNVIELRNRLIANGL